VGLILLEVFNIEQGKVYSVDRQDLEISEFDNVVFCFFEPSGETHIIDPFLAQILELCAERPLDINQLSKKTSGLLHTDMNQAWLATNQQALNKLVAINIVQTQSA
jgi:hypothetical protein